MINSVTLNVVQGHFGMFSKQLPSFEEVLLHANSELNILNNNSVHSRLFSLQKMHVECENYFKWLKWIPKDLILSVCNECILLLSYSLCFQIFSDHISEKIMRNENIAEK